MIPPLAYEGSLNEQAQEAILIFVPGDGTRESRQDLILKITVAGEVEQFAWVLPLPAEPKTSREDGAIFKELHDYVQFRRRPARPKASKGVFGGVDSLAENAAPKVEVLSRKIVGNYDVAVVREKLEGGLIEWLKANEYQVPEQAGELAAFYREKEYVFACVKVSEVALEKDAPVDLHPLRFSFSSGGRDGIYFPMRMTGLQDAPFDVNLYVFYDKWINDDLSPYGFVHRGFKLRWRDYDTRACEANAGKLWSAPGTDPYLRGSEGIYPRVTAMMQKLHPGKRFYLTNLYANRLNPDDVLDWSDDLWLFPYYTNRRFVPYDAREGGPAARGYE